MQKLSITEARKAFMKISDKTEGNQVMRNKEVMAIMSWDLYEGLLETLEILGDPELMGDIKQGMEEIKSGKTYSIEESRRRLGL